MSTFAVVQDFNPSRPNMESTTRKGMLFQVSLKHRESERILQQRNELMDYYKMDCSGLIKHLISKEHYSVRRNLNLV